MQQKAPSRMPHALVVDDARDVAEMLGVLLVEEGYSVAMAGSLREARLQVVMRPPDLVMLDLRLPDGDGMALLEELRALPRAEVVLVTGHVSVESLVQALRLGVSDYLNKPLNIMQFHGVLSRLRRPSTLHADAQGLQRTLDAEGPLRPAVGAFCADAARVRADRPRVGHGRDRVRDRRERQRQGTGGAHAA
jgi:two-component system response regulator AtoC